MQRKIIHVDMDAFFAAVEQRDFPQYRGKPVVVGGSPQERGVVSTCSYEARKYGIRSAMATSVACRLCPTAIFVPPRFDAYREASRQIREVFYSYTPLVEPLSLDEAYLDVSECQQHRGSATLMARAIKRQIYARTRLTASAGVSYNKFLAKVASDYNKPDGLTVITPDEGAAFAASLKIRQFYGVGAVTEKKMRALGIATGADLARQTAEFLRGHFGKFADYLYNAARGIDERPVRVNTERKSVGKETTFARDLLTREDQIPILHDLIARVFAATQPPATQDSADNANASKCAATQSAATQVTASKGGIGDGKIARTMTLKVRYADFTLITRSRTDAVGYTSEEQMREALAELIEKTEIGARPTRLLGITLSNPLGDEN